MAPIAGLTSRKNVAQFRTVLKRYVAAGRLLRGEGVKQSASFTAAVKVSVRGGTGQRQPVQRKFHGQISADVQQAWADVRVWVTALVLNLGWLAHAAGCLPRWSEVNGRAPWIAATLSGLIGLV